MKQPVPILAGSGLLLLLMIGFSHINSKGSPSGTWVEVVSETRARTLREVGTLEAREVARIHAPSNGVLTFLAEDGSKVSKGDLIMEMDREQLESRLEETRESLNQYIEDADVLRTEIAILKSNYETDTNVMKAELAQATLERDLGLMPLTEVERRLLEIERELGVLDVETKQANLVRQKELVRQNFAPAASLDQLELELSAAEIYLEEKKNQIALAEQPLPLEERLTLEAAWEKAKKNLDRKEARQELQLRIRDLQLKDLELEVAPRELDIQRIRKQLAEIETFAPADGIIRLMQTYSRSARAWRPRRVGENVWGLDAMATIVDPSQLHIRLMLHESDMNEIREGQRATARLTAFPEEVLTGTVSYMAEVGQDRDDLSPLYRQAPPIDQALFLIMIDVDPSENRAMPGMTAKVDIEIESLRPRMIVPGTALKQASPPYLLTRERDGVVEDVEVQGRFDRLGNFEVTRGLMEGDRVRLMRGGQDG